MSVSYGSFVKYKSIGMLILSKRSIAILLLNSVIWKAVSQTRDSAQKNSTDHFQFTYIAQKHAAFHSKYSGQNSLADTVEPAAKSVTATLFLGRTLWKGAGLYCDPEVSGGNGLSFTKGVAGALNGETYRVGAVEPTIFIARAYIQQIFPLSEPGDEEIKDDVNQIAGRVPKSRIVITAGKFAMSDFFDNNTYSKDPRTQFFNWSLWANGAWDYPANTRGYTFGLVTEIIKPGWSIRLSSVAVPRIANYHLMEYNNKVHSETIELERSFSIHQKKGVLRFILSNTLSRAPSYSQGLTAIRTNNTFLLNVISGAVENNAYGGKKFGVGLNVEQELTSDIGVFARMGWNDGKDVSWAFTEIDHTANMGVSFKGTRWKRPNDVFAIAAVVNGISRLHKSFLQEGGYGFIIGDGKLNYGNEAIAETFYNARLSPFFWLTADYQFVNDPGYNKDRGPVNVFSIRGHIEF
jgi:high affinity Mn2+ porin